MTVVEYDFTEPPAGRECCDICGSWRAELRRQPLFGLVADMDVCRVCFLEINAKDDFGKMQLIQKADYHV